jgi:hypothetical protein
MPRRDFNLTVALGDGPNSDNTWDSGIAVAANGSDDYGMLKGKPASTGDDIIGWTIKQQTSGDIVCLRTMMDGTIYAKLGDFGTYGTTTMGDPLWLTNDDTGTLTADFNLVETGQSPIAMALELDKGDGDYCEVYVYSQKDTVIT